MRTTQRKGDIAVSKAMARFTVMGFDVALPFTESAAYDLIVDTGKNTCTSKILRGERSRVASSTF